MSSVLQQQCLTPTENAGSLKYATKMMNWLHAPEAICLGLKGTSSSQVQMPPQKYAET